MAAESAKKRKSVARSAGSAKKVAKADVVGDVKQVQAVKPGQLAVGRVFKVTSGSSEFLMVKIGDKQGVRVRLTDAAEHDDWQSNPFDLFKNKSFIKCVILKNTKPNNVGSHEASLRPSLVDACVDDKLPEEALDQELEEATTFPVAGSLVKGFVESVEKAGVYVRIRRGLRGLVPRACLADHFVKEVEKEFPAGKLIAGRVLQAEQEKRKLVLSLKSSAVLGTSAGEKPKVGSTYGGRVTKLAEFGIFVQLDGPSKASGLVHISEFGDSSIQRDTIANHYNVGDRVRVAVLKTDPKVALSMKPEHLEDVDESGSDSGSGDDSDSNSDSDSESQDAADDSVEDESEEETSKTQKKKKKTTDDRKVMTDDGPVDLPFDDDSDEDGEVEIDSGSDSESDDENQDIEVDSDSDDEEEDDKPKVVSLKDALKQAKKGKAGSKQDDSDVGSDSDSDADSDEEAKGAQGSKAAEKRRKVEEAEIAAQEQAILEDDGSPQSVEDYERLLLGSPNSSMLWIQYMAFQTAQTEIDLARAVAERALQTINFREEDEKQNVWFALLQLEYQYGTPDAVKALIKRMLPTLHAKHAYMRIADMYEAGGELDKAEEALRKASKSKKGTSKTVWLKRIELKFNHGDLAGARTMLQHAIKSLPATKHVFLYLAFARLEYSAPEKGGSVERGRTMCEELITRAPKRNDLWHQYIDMEIKYGGGDVQRVDNLFERATSVKLSVKKIKAFFKKWLVYAAANGTEEDAERVKARARAYVESVTAE